MCYCSHMKHIKKWMELVHQFSVCKYTRHSGGKPWHHFLSSSLHEWPVPYKTAFTSHPREAAQKDTSWWYQKPLRGPAETQSLSSSWHWSLRWAKMSPSHSKACSPIEMGLEIIHFIQEHLRPRSHHMFQYLAQKWNIWDWLVVVQ